METLLKLSTVAKEYYLATVPANTFGLQKYIATDGENTCFVKSDYEPLIGEAVFFCKRQYKDGLFCQLYKSNEP